MRSIVRPLVVPVALVALAVAAAPAGTPHAERGGVIHVRIAVTSQAAGRPVHVQASVVDGSFSGDGALRMRTLRGDGELAVVAELTHTGRVTLVSDGGAIRAVAKYAAAPAGTTVSEAQWRRLELAQSGTRIEFRRVGSFVAGAPIATASR